MNTVIDNFMFKTETSKNKSQNKILNIFLIIAMQKLVIELNQYFAINTYLI